MKAVGDYMPSRGELDPGSWIRHNDTILDIPSRTPTTPWDPWRIYPEVPTSLPPYMPERRWDIREPHPIEYHGNR